MNTNRDAQREVEYINTREFTLVLPDDFKAELVEYEYSNKTDEPLMFVYQDFINEYLKEYIYHSDFTWYKNGVLYAILNTSYVPIQIKLRFGSLGEYRLFKLRSKYYAEQLKETMEQLHILDTIGKR